MTRLALVPALLLTVACSKGPQPMTQEELSTITEDDRPTKRSEILAIADEPSNSILFFGGNDGPVVNQNPRPNFHDDTWLFKPGVGWEEVATSGPSKRGRYGAAYDAVNRRAILYGGRFREADSEQYVYDLFDDLWEYDFETATWSELGDGEDGPGKRWYPSLAWDETSETLYLWGGLRHADPLAAMDVAMDLWKWSDADGWEEIATSGDEPSQRAFLGSTHDLQRNRLVIFGGQRGDFQSQAHNETYALDLESGEWELLDDGSAFSTRMHTHALYDGARDRYLVFGGHTDIGDDNDLWEYEVENDDYDLLYEGDTLVGGLGCMGNSSEVPATYVEQDLEAPERRHRAMFALMHDNLWIFGGMHAECSDHLDDTWRFDLETETWHELIEARTGESCARRGDDCECLCL